MKFLRKSVVKTLFFATCCGFYLTDPVSSRASQLLGRGEPVEVSSKEIDNFRIGDEETRFGKLTFLGGLELLASDRKIGGLSGLASFDSGKFFLAVTDSGHWVAGEVEQTAEGKPLDISNVRFAPLLDHDGKSLKRGRRDIEALAVSRDRIYVTAETRNAIYRYPWPMISGRDPMIGEVALPDDIRSLPRNTGLESLASFPDDSPYAGSLVAVAESAPSDAHNLAAFIIGPEVTARFMIRRSDRFDATDAAFLPNGDLLLLERRFNLRDLIGMRLRRFSADQLAPDVVLDGETLLEADFNYQIDNMEALAVHRNSRGETILTLVSDNNRSILQRALFLRFRLDH